MRLIFDLKPVPPAMGLAIDEALFEVARSSGEEIVRLWVNDRAVVIGRAQAIASEVDLPAAAAAGVPLLRRISGGGAVYHYPGNLNVSVVLRSIECGPVKGCFQLLGGLISEGLERLDVRVEAIGNLLLVGTRKVGGAAQARRGGYTLYHTTLLVTPPGRPIEHLLLARRPGYRTDGVSSVPRETTTLSEAVRRPIGIDEAADAVESGLTRRFALERSGLLDREEALADTLLESKYGRSSWNASR